jgi:hypothetical protein
MMDGGADDGEVEELDADSDAGGEESEEDV